MMHNTDLECIKMVILVFIFSQLGTEGTPVALCCLLVAITATTSNEVQWWRPTTVNRSTGEIWESVVEAETQLGFRYIFILVHNLIFCSQKLKETKSYSWGQNKNLQPQWWPAPVQAHISKTGCKTITRERIGSRQGSAAVATRTSWCRRETQDRKSMNH